MQQPYAKQNEALYNCIAAFGNFFHWLCANINVVRYLI